MGHIGANLDDYGFEVFEENEFPLAYLLTFRTYGTWLHGDRRYSVQRNGRSAYDTPMIEPTTRLESWMKDEMRGKPVLLDDAMRGVVREAVKDLCSRKEFVLHAVNIRTNHGHAVISAHRPPERIVNALKANATKMLRESGLVGGDERVWSRGRSRRYLWKPRHVEAAIHYTVYGQGDEEFLLVD